MIVKRMTATFGRLSRERLELEPGLNIIQAPNEGGKSTWAGFLRAMLYGIPTRDRDKKGYLADKNRYQPWSGAPMEGEAELVWQGREITLRRFAKGSVPFGGFSAVYTGTGEPVPGLTGENCGQTLLGVGREVYERSTFIGHNPTLAIDGTPELERRISALFSSGEEDVSFSQAEGRLREWQRRRQYNRSGLIPALEEELEQTRHTLARIEGIRAQAEQAEQRREELEREQAELEQEEHIHRRLAQRELNARYAQAREELQAAQAECAALERDLKRSGAPGREALKKAQDEIQYLRVLGEELQRGESALDRAREERRQAGEALGGSLFQDMTGEEARRAARRDTALGEQALRGQRRARGWGWGLLLAAALLTAGLGLVRFLIPGAAAALPGGVLWAILAIDGLLLAGCLYCFFRARRHGALRREALDRYETYNSQEIIALAEAHAVRWERAQEARREEERVRAALEDSRDRHRRCREELLAFVHTFAPEVKSPEGCSAALSRALSLEDRLRECRSRLELTRRRCEDLVAQGGQECDTLEMLRPPQRTPEQTRQRLLEVRAALAAADSQLAMTQGELRSLESGEVLEARQTRLQQQLERRRQEYEALTLALDVLRQANARLRERFAPELNRRAGEVLSRLTGGRYRALTLSREFECSAVDESSPFPRSALALSRGTVDQLYLAVRLAVCRLCLPEDDPAPLVLDDALTSFDDGRMALALDYLASMGQQVLLFTCQGREARYLAGREGVRILALQSSGDAGIIVSAE